MRVIVSGDRKYADREYLYGILTGLHETEPISYLIEGDAKGADQMAGQWAIDHGVQLSAIRADWNRYGRSAGPIRNARMLKVLLAASVYERVMVIGFHRNIAESKGTKNMLDIAKKAGVETRLYEGRSWHE